MNTLVICGGGVFVYLFGCGVTGAILESHKKRDLPLGEILFWPAWVPVYLYWALVVEVFFLPLMPGVRCGEQDVALSEHWKRSREQRKLDRENARRYNPENILTMYTIHSWVHKSSAHGYAYLAEENRRPDLSALDWPPALMRAYDKYGSDSHSEPGVLPTWLYSQHSVNKDFNMVIEDSGIKPLPFKLGLSAFQYSGQITLRNEVEDTLETLKITDLKEERHLYAFDTAEDRAWLLRGVAQGDISYCGPVEVVLKTISCVYTSLDDNLSCDAALLGKGLILQYDNEWVHLTRNLKEALDTKRAFEQWNTEFRAMLPQLAAKSPELHNLVTKHWGKV